MLNNDTAKLLSGIYKLARTGMQTSKEVIEKADDRRLRDELSVQYINYFKTANDAEGMLIKEGILPNYNSIITKTAMWDSSQLNTLSHVSTSHISEMMINGTTMEIISLTKHLNECKDANEASKNMARDFIRAEENHVDDLKRFLEKS